MCPSLPLNVLGSDLWNANAYSALSISYRVSAALRQQAKVINLAGKIWRLDKMLIKLLDDIYTGVDHPPANPEQVSPERIAAGIATLKKLHAGVESLYSVLQANALANRSIIGTPISSLRAHADELLDLAESIELSMDSDIDTVFNRSIEEYRRGEVFGLDTIG